VNKRLQNRVAEGKATFPVVATYALAVGLGYALLTGGAWLQLVLIAAATVGMLFLDKEHALLRIHSRMVACAYVMLALMIGSLSMSQRAVAVALCVVLAYLILFRAYQDKNAPGVVFYAFAMIGVASLMVIQVLFFVPLMWILLYTHVFSDTTRSFVASILGILVPYWFVAAYCIYASHIDDLADYVMQIAQFGALFEVQTLSVHHFAAFGTLLFLFLIGTVHFYRNSYKDKIRTRMFFEIFIIMGACTVIFAVLQPQHRDALLCIMTVNTAPLIAHFMALTNTRTTNWAFVAIVVVVLIATFYNVWMPFLLS